MVELTPHPLPSLEVLTFGNLGWIYRIDQYTVLKVPAEPRDENFAHELEAYDHLERHGHCPHIGQCFLRLPEGIFMQFYCGGNLQQRYLDRQVRSKFNSHGQVLEITEKDPINLIERWISELSFAVAWLEALGCVHGDLTPRNLLLDENDHLKLVDFEGLTEIGAESNGNQYPYARVLGPEAGDQEGSYGFYGPKTEQFAIGSIAYLMTRGYEPYDDKDFGPDHGPVVLDLFQSQCFPELEGGTLDDIILRCWRGQYTSIKDLAEETKFLEGACEIPQAMVLEPGYRLVRQNECQRLVDHGILERGDPNSLSWMA